MDETIIDLNYDDARNFLLRAQSYCNFGLPTYFYFQPLLNKLAACSSIPKDLPEDKYHLMTHALKSMEKNVVNYEMYTNKDGRLDWRPLELINPVAYVYLVNLITEENAWSIILKRFEEFRSNENIICCSLPPVAISNDIKESNIANWHSKFKMESIRLSTKFNYMFSTDILNCYSSIYTHSIAWALHPDGEAGAKENHSTELIGNAVDCVIQQISYNQTNGIPQGSVLMDFVAEAVLGYADLLLSNKIKDDSNIEEGSYHIIRYRDDYKIFTKDRNEAEKLGRYLSEVLAHLNLKLNPNKTYITDKIITDTQECDKLQWRDVSKNDDINTFALQVHSLAENYPNSGSIDGGLSDLYDMLENANGIDADYPVVVSIVIDIAYKNPRTYPFVIAILGKIITVFSDDERKELIGDIIQKFREVPNSEYFNIWLQRLSKELPKEELGESKLCDYVRKSIENEGRADLNIVWDFSKFSVYQEICKIINETSIFDLDSYIKMPDYPQAEEIKVFNSYS